MSCDDLPARFKGELARNGPSVRECCAEGLEKFCRLEVLLFACVGIAKLEIEEGVLGRCCACTFWIRCLLGRSGGGAAFSATSSLSLESTRLIGGLDPEALVVVDCGVKVLEKEPGARVPGPGGMLAASPVTGPF